MRVLYLNHTGLVSGGERSLLDMLAGLPEGVSPLVACPRGPLGNAAGNLGIPVFSVAETAASLRLHPWHSLQGVAQILSAGISVRRLVRREGVDLIHANSIRAGLMAVVSARLGGPPVVVHIRECLPRTRVANVVRRTLLHEAAVLISNSNYTAANFSYPNNSTVPLTIYNPIDLHRFNPQLISPTQARARLGLGESTPVIGVIAQITPWKGQDDAIRCAAFLRPAWPDLRLLIVGKVTFDSRATRYDNVAYASSLRRLIDELNLGDRVQFLGEREDVPQVMRALDILLIPSWEEPFGRVVIEAMAMETAIVATARGGPAEVIADGVQGRLLPPRQPKRWADVVGQLLADPVRRGEMVRRSRKVATSFGLDVHVGAVVEVYRRLLGPQVN
jgi:L-malate glycosyltransferase